MIAKLILKNCPASMLMNNAAQVKQPLVACRSNKPAKVADSYGHKRMARRSPAPVNSAWLAKANGKYATVAARTQLTPLALDLRPLAHR